VFLNSAGEVSWNICHAMATSAICRNTEIMGGGAG
jgi:hypothetical protein